LKLVDLLNEHDDVQNVFANFEVSDALVAKMGGWQPSLRAKRRNPTRRN